ncbi:MAG: polysaccharide deacetylase family protein [Ruminococcus sp.]|nr:polysaccharide deacetylase family protein [Ruminococcus sp.]
MYESYGLKRLLLMLTLDILILISGAALLLLGKLLFFTSAGEDSEAGVFLPVIMYHSVFDTAPREYTVTPEQLESDLKWLRDSGYTSVTAQQLINYTLGKDGLPERPVLITFDDGYYNNLSEALPLLEKYDMHAIVSVVGRYTDSLAPADPHVPAYSYLTWDDIKQLIASGRVEIGSHTYDMHSISGQRRGCAKLPGESDEEYADTLSADIGLLRTEMHSNTGYVPLVFAYPFGSISRESVPVLRDSGILLTLTCYERPNLITRDPGCLFGLFRYNRSGLYSTEEFMKRITEKKNGLYR